MNLSYFTENYPDIRIIAVSKYHSSEAVERLYHQGFCVFAESRVQDLKNKTKINLPIEWHMIGHLQSNKVKDCVALVNDIDSVDSLKLMKLIQDEAQKQNKTIRILIQVNFSNETHKYGISPEDCLSFFETSLTYPNLRCHGMMVIGPNTDDQSVIEECFQKAEILFHQIQNHYPQFKTLSMGMSQDYSIAAQYGATEFRLGTILF